MKLYLAVILTVLIIACSPVANTQERTAHVVMEPKSDSTATGTLQLRLSDGILKIKVDMSGVTPGIHGIHVHEICNCSLANASSAGGHFNPLNSTHGGPQTSYYHYGDLGNVEADTKGEIHTEIVTTALELDGASSIVGRSFVLHADPDDFQTQPAGNSGKRIACGVIVRK